MEEQSAASTSPQEPVPTVVKLAPKIEEKRYQRLRNKPLQGGNLQDIT